MKAESLVRALELCVDAISRSDMDTVDKVEILLNLKYFLEIDSYKRNIQLLQQKQKEERDNKRFR